MSLKMLVVKLQMRIHGAKTEKKKENQFANI